MMKESVGGAEREMQPTQAALMTHTKMQDDAEQQPSGSHGIRRRLEIRVSDSEYSFEAEEAQPLKQHVSFIVKII